MSLLARLTGTELPKIAVHQFWASMVQYARGRITEAQLKTAFSIVGGTDLSEWDWLKGRYVAATDKVAFLQGMHVLFMCAETGLYNYNDPATITAEINALI